MGSLDAVAPSAGAWIEIFSIQSHIPVILVAPSAGAWIEIVKQLNELLDKEVAPSAGAWIEMPYLLLGWYAYVMSLPPRERGLKS